MRIRTAASIVREGRKNSAIAKRKEQVEEIKAANDAVLKNDVSDMLYILGLRGQMSPLTAAELGALDILKAARTKKQRFCAIKRVKHIAYS